MYHVMMYIDIYLILMTFENHLKMYTDLHDNMFHCVILLTFIFHECNLLWEE